MEVETQLRLLGAQGAAIVNLLVAKGITTEGGYAEFLGAELRRVAPKHDGDQPGMRHTGDWPVYTGWIVVYPTQGACEVPFCNLGSGIYPTEKEAWAHADGVHYTVAKVEVCLPPVWYGQRQLAEQQKKRAP